jgi:hypothetical protein
MLVVESGAETADLPSSPPARGRCPAFSGPSISAGKRTAVRRISGGTLQ